MKNRLCLYCLIGIGLFVLEGCASKPVLWQLNGKSKQDLDNRHFQCQDFAQNNSSQNPSAPGNMGYGMGAGNPYMALGSLVQIAGSSVGFEMFYERCMNEGGFYRAN